jgi:hypothetical protein
VPKIIAETSRLAKRFRTKSIRSSRADVASTAQAWSPPSRTACCTKAKTRADFASPFASAATNFSKKSGSARTP